METKEETWLQWHPSRVKPACVLRNPLIGMRKEASKENQRNKEWLAQDQEGEKSSSFSQSLRDWKEGLRHLGEMVGDCIVFFDARG